MGEAKRAEHPCGCDARDNEAQEQKTRRPEGFRGNGRLAALLLSRRPMKASVLRAWSYREA